MNTLLQLEDEQDEVCAAEEIFTPLALSDKRLVDFN